MEPYINITTLNDYIFCPRSIYFKKLYGQYRTSTYHRTPQTSGIIAHKSVDTATYSTSKRHITGLRLYSNAYNLCGVLDLYDSDLKLIVERKRQIKVIYDGYRYQLYAQYYCLLEMGYTVEKLALHSLIDNKRYPIALPNAAEAKQFKNIVSQIRSYDLHADYQPNIEKCRQCIYSHLCDHSLV